MTAQLLKFPAGYQAPARQLDAPCQILILPVVKIEHEDSIRAKRRRAYERMREALSEHQTISLMQPMFDYAGGDHYDWSLPPGF